MIAAFKDLIFPSLCLYCNEPSPFRFILCPLCEMSVEFLSPFGRCKRCFALKDQKKCESCSNDTSWFERGAALFERGSKHERFISDPYRFAKTIAAFFVIQMNNLHWPTFTVIKGIPFFSPVVKETEKFFGLKPKRKIPLDEDLSILFLGKSLHHDKPAEFTPNVKVFFLALTE